MRTVNQKSKKFVSITLEQKVNSSSLRKFNFDIYVIFLWIMIKLFNMIRMTFQKQRVNFFKSFMMNVFS